MEDSAKIVIRIDTKDPIQVSDFVAAVTSVSSQFEKFIRASRPDLSADTGFRVASVRSGSILIDLIPWAAHSIASVIPLMDQILILEQFVKTYRAKLESYFEIGGRFESATKSDLSEFMDQVSAIARDPDASSLIEAVAFEQNQGHVKAALKFDTKSARRALKELLDHRNQLEATSGATHTRVLMQFKRSDRDYSKIGKLSGERVIIESLSDKDLPLIYASELAEQRIKHEVGLEGENIFRKGFVVDVNVEMRGQRSIAYRVTDVHQVIPLE